MFSRGSSYSSLTFFFVFRGNNANFRLLFKKHKIKISYSQYLIILEILCRLVFMLCLKLLCLRLAKSVDIKFDVWNVHFGRPPSKGVFFFMKDKEQLIRLTKTPEEIDSVDGNSQQWSRKSSSFPLPPTYALQITNQALSIIFPLMSQQSVRKGGRRKSKALPMRVG